MLKSKKSLHNLLISSVVILSLFLACKPTLKIGQGLEQDKLIDGIYEGSYKGGPNSAEVKVTIEDQKIVSIEIIKHNTWKGKKAEPIIPNRIIEKQSTNVDAVTGATNSSHIIMNAVQKAIEKAYAATKK
jgi:uncharacterized protein with FMN-binding domain